jgi:glutathionylspermidine synthase
MRPRAVARRKAPLRAGELLPPDAFAAIRTRLMLRHCKWDPQVEDVSTLAPFPLLMSRSTWRTLCADAESLAAELMVAERELLDRPALHGTLSIPRRLRAALRATQTFGSPPVAVRVMRFDFHWTDEGWRISEVNSDVPGGFCEAGAFAQLVADHVQHAEAPDDPGARWADAMVRCAGHGGHVALLATPGFMEDQQVVGYMGRLLAERGLTPHLTEPAQLRWRDLRASLGNLPLAAIVRFYQAEWLASLPRRSRCHWQPLAAGGRTAVTNPISAALTESKRFPLVWDQLATTLPTWRRLLPETRNPREAPWRRDDGWLLKTAFCNTGDTVSAASLLPPKLWRKAKWSARLCPGAWIAQRRFNTLRLATATRHGETVDMYPCIGVYTLDGRAAGAYARLSHRPVVDYRAVDAALLIENVDDDDDREEAAA